MPDWLRNYFLLPLLVGIIVGGFTLGVPFIFKKKTEISYNIEGPQRYLEDPALKNIQILVSGKTVSKINGYRIIVWNSGSNPIKKLPLRLVFEPIDKDFEIFAVTHDTTPKFEFGKITELEGNQSSRRFEYELFNINDQDIIGVLTNKTAPLQVYAKTEGLFVKKIEQQKQEYFPFMFTIIGALASILSVGLKYTFDFFFRKKLKKQA